MAQEHEAQPKMYQIEGDRAELASDRIHRPSVDALALRDNKMTLRARAGREARQRVATAELQKRQADDRARARAVRLVSLRAGPPRNEAIRRGRGSLVRARGAREDVEEYSRRT